MKKHIVHFYITKGKKQYVAEGVELAVVTQAATLDKLVANIHEATQLHLASNDPADFGLISSPLISVNFEMPQMA